MGRNGTVPRLWRNRPLFSKYLIPHHLRHKRGHDRSLADPTFTDNKCQNAPYITGRDSGFRRTCSALSAHRAGNPIAAVRAMNPSGESLAGESFRAGLTRDLLRPPSETAYPVVNRPEVSLIRRRPALSACLARSYADRREKKREQNCPEGGILMGRQRARSAPLFSLEEREPTRCLIHHSGRKWTVHGASDQ